MREVQGFVTSDRAFFEHKYEAEMHEATVNLWRAFDSHGIKEGSIKAVIDLINAYAANVRRYLDALEGQPKPEPEPESLSPDSDDEEDEPDTAIGSGYDPLSEEDLTPTQQLKARGDEPVSDVGSGIKSKIIRANRTINGPRSGDVDA